MEKNQNTREAVREWGKEHRRMLGVGLAALLIAGGGSTLVLTMTKGSAASDETVYREYQVQAGDLTVGTTESGTIALERETVTFPVSATIDTVLVKAGSQVAEGDSLLVFDKDSVTDGSASAENQLTQAKLSLDQALTDQKIKLEEAKQAYENSMALSGYSATAQKLSTQEIDNGIAEAKNNLENAKADFETYQALQKSWPSDKARLDELEGWLNDAEEIKKAYENQLSDLQTDYKTTLDTLNTLQSDLQKAKTAYEGAGSGNSDELYEKYQSAKNAYDAYQDDIEDLLDEQTALEDKVDYYTTEYNNYLEAYNDFKETYTENYKQEGDELDQAVESAKLSAEKAQVSYDKAVNESKLSLLKAEQQFDSSVTEISAAQTTYSIAQEKLALEVATQQSSYNAMVKQMADLDSVIGGDGTLTAPCNGTVSSVMYTDGDDVSANQVILTILKPSALSMSISLSEEDITSVQVGQEASITLTAYDGQTFAAAVDSISTEPARSGSTSVTYTVTIKMTQENKNTVYEGMSGEVTLIQKQVQDTLYVSNQAVVFEDGQSYVLVKNSSGSSVKTPVTTGFTNGRYVEILSGLSMGQTVLAESAVQTA